MHFNKVRTDPKTFSDGLNDYFVRPYTGIYNTQQQSFI